MSSIPISVRCADSSCVGRRGVLVVLAHHCWSSLSVTSQGLWGVGRAAEEGSWWWSVHGLKAEWEHRWEPSGARVPWGLCQQLQGWTQKEGVNIRVSIKWKWKSLSRVWLFATPWTMKSMEFSRPNTGVGSLSLLHGIFLTQGSNPGHPHCRQILYQLSHTGKPKNIGVHSLSLLQGIFLTRESNWGLLHCRVILYQLSYQGSPCLSIRR